MKRRALALLAVAPFFAAPAYAVDFWHSNTVWAGHGQCAAVFTFDSGLEEIRNLQVSVSAVDKSGKKIASGVLEIKRFGQSTADRYSEAFLEGEEICADDLTIVVTKATATVAGKRTDLLKGKSLSPRDFKPFKLRIGK